MRSAFQTQFFYFAAALASWLVSISLPLTRLSLDALRVLYSAFFALPLTAGTGAILSPLTIGAVSILLPPPRLNREQNTLQIFFQREYHILFWIQVIPKIGWNGFIQMKKVRHNNENCIGICQSNR